MIILHIVFSTKNREPLITAEIQPLMHAYLSGACRAIGCEAFRVGGTENHVHIACSLPRTITVAKLIEEIKKSSSAWAKRQPGACAQFGWQSGYGVFSLGQSRLPILLRYIDNQKEHHQTRTFNEEYLCFMKENGVKYDETYVWD